MELQQLLGLILIPASLLGVVCNGLVVIATWKSRSLSHSFSLLTANQALFNGLHSAICLIYLMPMYVFDIELLKANSHHCGFIMLLCYDITMYSHFLVATNRFCAVFLPITYRTLFDAKCTKIIILSTILLSLSVYTVFFQILPCRCSYSSERWAFVFSGIPLCHTYFLLDAVKVVVLTVFDVVIDTITISKVRRTRTIIGKGQPAVTTGKKKEMNFLKQSFSQSLYVFLAMPAILTVPVLTDNKTIEFVVGNVFWCLLHALDGVFTLKFNSQVRKGLGCDDE